MPEGLRLALLGLALAFIALACAPPAPDAPAEVSARELLGRLDAGEAPVLLDVRSREEYAAGHVPGARNLPHDELAARAGELAELRDEELVLYCESGRRAEFARQILAERGFRQLRHLDGDMSGWREAGLPTE